jgi:hypothetical protein
MGFLWEPIVYIPYEYGEEDDVLDLGLLRAVALQGRKRASAGCDACSTRETGA